MNIKILTILGFTFGLIGLAQATLITETWTGTISNVSGPTDNNIINEMFTVTATYDDAEDVYHQYNDAGNGVAEFGEGDDYVNWTICADTAIGSTGCSWDASASTTRAADALIDFSSLLALIAPVDTDDNYNLNQSMAMDYGSDAIIHLFADDVSLYLTTNGTGSIYFFTDDIPYFAGLQVSNVSRAVANVPEPSAIALMGLGLLGFVATRRKRQK